jgi:hypothetical protein
MPRRTNRKIGTRLPPLPPQSHLDSALHEHFGNRRRRRKPKLGEEHNQRGEVHHDQPDGEQQNNARAPSAQVKIEADAGSPE